METVGRDRAGAITRVENERFEQEMRSLLALLGREDINGARRIVREMTRDWPDSERVAYLARVLAPPEVRVRPGERGRRLNRERAWLYEHASRYPGQWLAILGDELLAADPVLGKVLTDARSRPGGDQALLHYEPGMDE